MPSKKASVKDFLVRNFPELFYVISGLRRHRRNRRLYKTFQDTLADKLYENESQVRVLSGPFKGLRYFNKIVWGCITPKWLGTHEMELYPVFEEIIDSGPETIIDVGAAEGYYGAGFAFKLPDTHVFTFDIDPLARRLQNRLRQINDLPNLSINKCCSHATLEKIVTGHTVLICDCEGYEADLLDPDLCENLLNCDILVEIHAYQNLNAEEVLALVIQRFSPTHSIRQIGVANRDVASIREAAKIPAGITDEELLQAASEPRPGDQKWLWLKRETIPDHDQHVS